MRLIILGAGGYGRTVADVAAQTGAYDKILFLDDNSQAEDVIGKCANFPLMRIKIPYSTRHSEITKAGYRG